MEGRHMQKKSTEMQQGVTKKTKNCDDKKNHQKSKDLQSKLKVSCLRGVGPGRDASW